MLKERPGSYYRQTSKSYDFNQFSLKGSEWELYTFVTKVKLGHAGMGDSLN